MYDADVYKGHFKTIRGVHGIKTSVETKISQMCRDGTCFPVSRRCLINLPHIYFGWHGMMYVYFELVANCSQLGLLLLREGKLIGLIAEAWPRVLSINP